MVSVPFKHRSALRMFIFELDERVCPVSHISVEGENMFDFNVPSYGF